LSVRHCGNAKNAGEENAGLENAGVSGKEILMKYK